MAIDGLREWLREHPVRVDTLIALCLVLAACSFVSSSHRYYGPAWLLGPALVLGGAPVVVRRWRPWWAVAGTALVCVATSLAGVPNFSGDTTLLLVLYSCAALLPLRRALIGTVVLTLATVFELIAMHHPSPDWAFVAGSLPAAFFIGRTVFTRHAYTAALEERARTAEQSREALAREAVLEERRRIARELHDVVAHHVSVMGVMATGARRALTRDPASADEALATIESTGRATLREMRRLLDVLRRDDETDAAFQPQPGVEGLRALAEQVREAGLTVRLTVAGTPRPLDPGIDLTIYRIVQEGLTNALKHAGPASAQVSIAFHPDRIVLTVDDDGAGESAVPSGRSGHGLVGMRERVALYGGSLRAGPRGSQGYSLAADIPLDPAPEVIR
jgi:signal transduction histidine kinase